MEILLVLIGGVLGFGSSFMTQRMQLRAMAARSEIERRHADRQQWDKDVVKLAGEMISTVRSLVPTGYHWSNVYFKDTEKAQELGELIDAGLNKVRLLAAELQLVASTGLTESVHKFVLNSDRWLTDQFEVVEDEEGNPVALDNKGPERSTPIEDTISAFVSAVKIELRVA